MKLKLVFLFSFVLLFNGIAKAGPDWDPPKAIKLLEASVDGSGAPYVYVVCTDGSSYIYQYPDPNNSQNSAEGRTAILAILLSAYVTGDTKVNFHFNGSISGTKFFRGVSLGDK